MDMQGKKEKHFDVIVFGATGYTGKYVVEELGNVCMKHNIKWAVAGRHEVKLQSCLQEVQEFLPGVDLIQNVGIIVADVGDPDSIFRMCSQARLILNCVGPYLLYGEVVVRACIENGTHMVDISGESKYLEETQADYFHKARDQGVFIAQSCGFDSIPADLGTALLKKRYDATIGKMESVKIFVKFVEGTEGKVINIGTWLSAVNAIRYIFQAKGIRQYLMEKVFTKNAPDYNTGFGFSMPLSYYGGGMKWCLPLSTPDAQVIQRTQMFNSHFCDEVPLKNIKVFLRMSSFIRAIGLIFLAAIVGGLSFFSFGRKLLGKFPSLFSFGYFSANGPSRKQVLNSSFTVTLLGTGHCYESDGLAFDKGHQQMDEKSNLLQSETRVLSDKVQNLSLKITGPDPAYVFTSRCMVHAGLVILEEQEKLPLQGGILTPGVAFINTTLADRLKDRGMKFEFM